MLDNLTITKVKPVVDQLKRIADALEIIVKYEYGYTMTPTPKPVGEDESDVMYTTEESLLKQQLQNIVDLRVDSDVVDVEEYPDTK